MSRFSLILSVALALAALAALIAGSFVYVVFFTALAVIAVVVAFTDFRGGS